MTYQMVAGAGDGVSLAVTTWGPATGTPVVLVHGYPDTSSVWHAIAERLAAAGLFVVAYDVRGAGASTAPRETRAYTMALLAEDLARVIDATCGGRPVHLVGHDWGSIQSWEAVTDPVFAHRLASFTTISGPCLDHVGMWMRSHLDPVQVLKSWYVYAFHAPFAPLAWRLIAPRWDRYMARVEGVPPSPGDRARDGANGIALYRANILPRLAAPRARGTLVPVQLIVPMQDKYVDPSLYVELAKWAPNLSRRDVVAGHWGVLADADLVAGWLRAWIAGERPGVGAAGAKPRLAVVTGAGSGIGRATALELCARGHAVVCADIDLGGARVTAELAAAMGAACWAKQVDVADAAAMTRFAADVRREHGVPDVVVNNAGVAVAGGFMATPEGDWDRVLGINLDGVARGCRLFARQMLDDKRAGHIVNIASAAAFAPSRTFPAYTTSKAAVVMLSECLRAELAGHRIGVTAVCPGFVDTPITGATRFVGETPEREARKRRAAAVAYRRRGLTADDVARRICDAIEANTPLVTVGVEASAVRWMARLAPGLARRIAKVDFA